MKIRLALVLLLVLSVSAPASAQRRGMGPRFEASVLGGYRFGGTFSNGNYAVADSVNLDDLEIDDAGTYGAVLGWNFSENGQLEGSWSRQETDVTLRDGSAGQREELGPLTLDVLHVAALYRFGRYYDTARPWLGIGLGTTVFGTDGGDSAGKFSFGMTFGSHFSWDRRWALRLQGRFITTFIDEQDALICSYGCWTGVTKSYLRQFELSAGLTMRL